MRAMLSSLTRRSFLATSAAAGVFSLFPEHVAATGDAPSKQPSKQGASTMRTTENTVIRPFRVNIPDEGARRSSPAHQRDNVA
jgi:hypothetical protein